MPVLKHGPPKLGFRLGVMRVLGLKRPSWACKEPR